jgi:hypothetical protein
MDAQEIYLLPTPGSQADGWITRIAPESTRGARAMLLRARQGLRSNRSKRSNQRRSASPGLRAVRSGRPSCLLSAWSWSWVPLP